MKNFQKKNCWLSFGKQILSISYSGPRNLMTLLKTNCVSSNFLKIFYKKQ